MPDEQEIRKVYVSLETRGDVRPGLEDAERAAAASQQRIQQRAAAAGTVRAPLSPAGMVSQIAAATGEDPTAIARALGMRGTAPASAAGVHPMAAAMSRAANPSMIERLQSWQRQNEARLRIGQEAAAGERGATPGELKALGLGIREEERGRRENNRQLGLFSRETEQAWRGLDKFSRATTGFGLGGQLAGAAGTAGLVAGASLASLEASKHILALTQRTVALADPGRAYQLTRAQADLQGALGRGLIPLHDRYTTATRSAADFLAAHPEGIGRAAGGLAGAIPGLTALEGIANWLGKGNKGKSVGAAANPELGQVFGTGDDLYRAFASRAIMTTPEKGAAEAGGEALKEAAVALKEAAKDISGNRAGEGAMTAGTGGLWPLMREAIRLLE